VTLLLFIPPLLHFGTGLRGLELPMALLPPLALLSHHLKPSPWLSHFAFPCAHLPLLLTRPELCGPEVYGGLRGLIALLLVVLSFVVFLATTHRQTRSPTASALPPLAFALAPVSALAAAVLGSEGAPESASLAVMFGPLIALFAIQLAREPRAAALSAIAARSRPRVSILVTTAFLALVALAGCAFWLLWSPR